MPSRPPPHCSRTARRACRAGLLDRATGLRPTPAAAGAAPALSKNATEAAAWLARVEGVSAAAAADAYEAGENNGFVTTLRGQPTSILFEKLARFNHSCWPNCGLSREEATGMTRVYTVAAVPADAELKISYSDEFVLYPTQVSASPHDLPRSPHDPRTTFPRPPMTSDDLR